MEVDAEMPPAANADNQCGGYHRRQRRHQGIPTPLATILVLEGTVEKMPHNGVTPSQLVNLE